MSVFTIHTDVLFDPKLKEFRNDISVTVNAATGLISKVFKRTEPLPDAIQKPDLDLRGKVVLPGFVDAHTHIFLHSYE
jgi:cytosine/adenosine deaminase-related metal-dependent hydrolase